MVRTSASAHVLRSLRLLLRTAAAVVNMVRHTAFSLAAAAPPSADVTTAHGPLSWQDKPESSTSRRTGRLDQAIPWDWLQPTNISRYALHEGCTMSWWIDRALAVTASPTLLMEGCCPTETGFHSDYEHCLAHETISEHHWGRLGWQSLNSRLWRQGAVRRRTGRLITRSHSTLGSTGESLES